MQYLRYIVIITVPAAAALNGFSQTEVGTKKDSAKTSTKVVVFDQSQTARSSYYFGTPSVDSTMNAIKINPLLIVKGDLPVYYERKLGNKLSAETAVGITFLDYTYELFHNDLEIDRDIMHVRTGFSFKFQLRFFPGRHGTAISDYYFTPEISYRVHYKDMKVQDPSTGYYTNTYLRDTRALTEFKLVFGYQDLSWSDNVFFDWYCGVGFRSTHLEEVKYDYTQNMFGQTVYSTVIVPDDFMSPVFVAGVKLGLGF